jgi:hypothetical protein
MQVNNFTIRKHALKYLGVKGHVCNVPQNYFKKTVCQVYVENHKANVTKF